jgi:hypothetical protein
MTRVNIAIVLNCYNHNTDFLSEGTKLNDETIKGHQSKASTTGKAWENYVESFLVDRLNASAITIIRGNQIKENSPLWKKLSIPTKASTVQDSVWGDIDLVAMKDNIVIVVISCKTSLHGRFTETLFYGVLFRMWSRVKFVLVTADTGRGGETWKSEWGTPEAPTKDRMLAESYLAGVYVENVPEFCPKKKSEECTVLGGIVRNMGELPDDLRKWAEEEARFIYAGKQKKL